MTDTLIAGRTALDTLLRGLAGAILELGYFGMIGVQCNIATPLTTLERLIGTQPPRRTEFVNGWTAPGPPGTGDMLFGIDGRLYHIRGEKPMWRACGWHCAENHVMPLQRLTYAEICDIIDIVDLLGEY